MKLRYSNDHSMKFVLIVIQFKDVNEVSCSNMKYFLILFPLQQFLLLSNIAFQWRIMICNLEAIRRRNYLHSASTDSIVKVS